MEARWKRIAHVFLWCYGGVGHFCDVQWKPLTEQDIQGVFPGEHQQRQRPDRLQRKQQFSARTDQKHRCRCFDWTWWYYVWAHWERDCSSRRQHKHCRQNSECRNHGACCLAWRWISSGGHGGVHLDVCWWRSKQSCVYARLPVKTIYVLSWSCGFRPGFDHKLFLRVHSGPCRQHRFWLIQRSRGKHETDIHGG